MGDSITDFWRNADGPYAGKPVLDKHFGQWKIANFGIAGDTTQGVLYRLQNGEGQGFSPKAIMLMIGTNNTARNTAAEIAEGVGAVVLELQKDFPQAKILLLGDVSARPSQRSRARHDCRHQPQHREAARRQQSALPRHRRTVPRCHAARFSLTS